jgi:hypothetical protein
MSQYPLANRGEELDLFDRMVAGETRERILLPLSEDPSLEDAIEVVIGFCQQRVLLSGQ